MTEVTCKDFILSIGAIFLAMIFGPFIILYKFINSIFIVYFTDKGKWQKVIVKNDIETVEKLIDDPNFDIYQEIVIDVFMYECFLDNKYMFIRDTSGMELMVLYQRNEMMKLILSCSKLRDHKLQDCIEQSINNNRLDDETHQLMIDKIKHFNLSNKKLLKVLISKEKIDLICNNIEFFIKDNSRRLFHLSFKFSSVQLLDKIYDNCSILPLVDKNNGWNETNMKFKLDINFIMSLERFENFDDFFINCRDEFLNVCDQETCKYLSDKY